MDQQKPTVRITVNGPFIVSGNVPLSEALIGTNENGESVSWDQGKSYPSQEEYALCRCGHSAGKPFCDGSHATVGFDGSETASRRSYRDQSRLIRGPAMSLTDVENLCAFARFCDPHGNVWHLVKETDKASARALFLAQTCDCPSGRLVAWDNDTGAAMEPKYEPSIVLLQDPARRCSGPAWLRGGVQLIGADGFEYEVRNRVTLCRCGASQNKPFCDGSHAAIGFTDGSESVPA